MTPRPASRRSGITLTEILISILIMGVGLISLATLFPIGLVRLRQAQQQSRSGLLGESAVGDMGAKNLLSKPTFLETYYGNFDPFLVDATPAGAVTLTTVNPINLNAANTNNYNFTGGGLPICYDPLWRSVTGIGPIFQAGAQVGPNSNLPFPNGSFQGNAEARFAAGIVNGNSYVRQDPQGGLASAHGLQRITNFVPWCANTIGWALTYHNPGLANPASLRDYAVETFVSPEDVVMQNSEPNQVILNNPNSTGQAGSVVPMFFPVLNGAGVQVGTETRSDYRYTWLFTGRQIDTSNGTQFDGDVVVMENRPFALDQVVSPVTGTPSNVAAGEIVVEAIFGYGFATYPVTTGYAVAGDRTVLLRWPANMPDPEFKVGSWIADVTYERYQSLSDTRSNHTLTATGTGYPFQRCHWYQIAKKSDVTPDVQLAGYRQMTVYTTTPLKAKTLLSGGSPVNLNVALFMPSVVNVFQKTFYVR